MKLSKSCKYDITILSLPSFVEIPVLSPGLIQRKGLYLEAGGGGGGGLISGAEGGLYPKGGDYKRMYSFFGFHVFGPMTGGSYKRGGGGGGGEEGGLITGILRYTVSCLLVVSFYYGLPAISFHS